MLGAIKRHQDRFAGGLITALGLLTAAVAGSYPQGTLRAMGPGFFPLILGVVMTVLGALIALAAPDPAAAAEPDPHGAEGLDRPELRGWLCILGGVLAFILLAQRAGMLPATFACVFIAARGDRSATLRSSLILAAVIAVAGVLLFHYGLRIQLAPINW